MSDTRCANAEFQVDVDLMILEYTLYNATKAQFDALTADAGYDAKWAETARVFGIFDTFIRLFNQKHPSYDKTPGLLFNLKILEFLVLFSSQSSAMGPDFSEDHFRALREDAVQNMGKRRRWISFRHNQKRQLGEQHSLSQSNLARDIEYQIYAAWNRGESKDYPRYTHWMPDYFELLPRFMEISAEIAPLLGDPNEKWMQIACEFMLQAALGSLGSQLEWHEDATTEDTSKADWCSPQLDECFAWGYVDDTSTLVMDEADDKGLEDLVNNLFCAATEEPPERSSGENPLWTKIRAEYLSEFSIASDASAQSQSCRLDRLAMKYSLAEFQDTLLQFLHKVWDNTCKDEINGKPILVQIEEGHLKSLDVEGQDFDDFMVRVGLKKDMTGLLKLKL